MRQGLRGRRGARQRSSARRTLVVIALVWGRLAASWESRFSEESAEHKKETEEAIATSGANIADMEEQIATLASEARAGSGSGLEPAALLAYTRTRPVSTVLPRGRSRPCRTRSRRSTRRSRRPPSSARSPAPEGACRWLRFPGDSLFGSCRSCAFPSFAQNEHADFVTYQSQSNAANQLIEKVPERCEGSCIASEGSA